MRLRSTVLVLLTLGSLVTGVVWAAKGLGTFLLAFPGYGAQWQKGEGVPDLEGSKNQHGLLMEKADPTVATNGSQAVITGADGVTITELGFDVRNDGVCGAAPFFQVRVGEVRHVFPCSAGVSSPTPEDPTNWTRVRFPSALGLAPDDIRVIFRLPAGEGGLTYLDNLDVNGTFIGKPGGGNR